MAAEFTGRCACGAIRYEVTAEPIVISIVIAVIVRGRPAVVRRNITTPRARWLVKTSVNFARKQKYLRRHYVKFKNQVV